MVGSARASAGLSFFTSRAPNAERREEITETAADQDAMVRACYDERHNEITTGKARSFSSYPAFTSAVQDIMIGEYCATIFSMDVNTFRWSAAQVGAADLKRRSVIALVTDRALDYFGGNSGLRIPVLMGPTKVGPANQITEGVAYGEWFFSYAFFGSGPSKGSSVTSSLGTTNETSFSSAKSSASSPAMATGVVPFDRSELETLYGPLVGSTSGGHLVDSDVFISALKRNRKETVGAALSVSQMDQCLGAKVNDIISRHSSAGPWGIHDPLTRRTTHHPVLELAARAQQEYLISMRNFLVELSRTVGSTQSEKEGLRAWIDALAFGRFVSVAAPGVELCGGGLGDYEVWMARHVNDEALTKLTGATIRGTARTCDNSPLTRGPSAIPGPTPDELARLASLTSEGDVGHQEKASKGKQVAGTKAPPAITTATAPATGILTLDDAKLEGEDGLGRLLAERFGGWVVGRYGAADRGHIYDDSTANDGAGVWSEGAKGEAAATDSENTPAVVAETADIRDMVSEKLGEKMAGLGRAAGNLMDHLISTKPKPPMPATPVTATPTPKATTAVAPQGTKPDDKVEEKDIKTKEIDAKRMAAGKALFMRDWQQPSPPCDGFVRAMMGQGCEIASTQAAGTDSNSPDVFIHEAIMRLKLASEAYAALYLMLAQEDIGNGAFRVRATPEEVCSQRNIGADPGSLVRRRDAAEVGLMISTIEESLSEERIGKQIEERNAQVVSRDFDEMFKFVLKAKKAGMRDDTGRASKHMRKELNTN